MAVSFPQNPQEGDSFASGNYIFVFTDGKWVSAAVNPNYTNIQGATGATGPQGADGGGGDPGVRYQQGTWTPLMIVAESPYSTLSGFTSESSWTRVGNLVTLNARFNNASGRSGSSYIETVGLPYPFSSGKETAGSAMYTSIADSGFDTLIPYIKNSSNDPTYTSTGSILFYRCYSGNSENWNPLTLPELATSGTTIIFTVSYLTDDTTFNAFNGATITEDIQGTGGGSGNYNGASAWANFDGTIPGVSPISASQNIASITRTGVGIYDVVFTTPLPSDNYAVVSNTYSFTQNTTTNGFTILYLSGVGAAGDVNPGDFVVFASNTIAPPAGVGADSWGSAASDGTLEGGFNVASVTNTDAGEYDVVFTTPMPSDDYAVSSISGNSNCSVGITNKTTAGFTVKIRNQASGSSLVNQPFNFTVHASSTVTPTYTWTREGTTLKPANDGDNITLKEGTYGKFQITTRGVAGLEQMTVYNGSGDATASIASDGSAQFGPDTAAKVSMEGMGTTQGELVVSNPTGSNSFNCFRVVGQGTNTIVFKQGGGAAFNPGNGSFTVGTNAGNTSVDLRNSGGSVAVSLTNDANCFKTGGGSWSANASAARLKDVVGDVEKDQAWSLLRDIELKRYWFKTETERTGVPWMGLIAEEAAALDPELKIVTNETDDEGEIWSYNMSVLQVKSMAALSYALTRIEELEARIDLLEGN